MLFQSREVTRQMFSSIRGEVKRSRTKFRGGNYASDLCNDLRPTRTSIHDHNWQNASVCAFLSALHNAKLKRGKIVRNARTFMRLKGGVYGRGGGEAQDLLLFSFFILSFIISISALPSSPAMQSITYEGAFVTFLTLFRPTFSSESEPICYIAARQLFVF